jgi:hypothetical protein
MHWTVQGIQVANTVLYYAGVSFHIEPWVSVTRPLVLSEYNAATVASEGQGGLRGSFPAKRKSPVLKFKQSNVQNATLAAFLTCRKTLSLVRPLASVMSAMEVASEADPAVVEQ